MLIEKKMEKKLLFKKRLYFRWTCTFLVLLLNLQVFAQVSKTGDQSQVVQQKAKITGTVNDGDGKPLPGTTVMIKGTSNGTMTNVDGNFSLNVPDVNKTILVFKLLGFEPLEVPLLNKTEINVTLKEKIVNMDEVVITALGISREAKSLGYSRQSVDVTSMTEARDANLVNMLAGKAAGVNVISAGGSTASTRVQIRGINSLTGNNQPLYVVDGVVIQNDMGKVDGMSMGADGATDIDYGNIASNINADDVENIEILKGGNASALYGSDAANGVILITTKKGKNNKELGVTYSLNYMANTIIEYPPFQNVYGGGNSSRLGETNKYRSMVYQSMAVLTPYNGSSWGVPMLGFDVVGRNGLVKAYSPNPDNVRDYFSSSAQITNNVSISKSNDFGSVRFSYTNTTSNDVVKGTNERDRNNFSISTDYNLVKNINVAANIRYSIDKLRDRPYSGWSDRNPMMAYINFPRDLSLSELTPWKDASGNAISLTTGTGEFYNPYWALNEDRNEDTKNWLLSDFTTNINFTKTLKLKLTASADIQNSNGYDFTNKGTNGTPNGMYSIFSRGIKNYQYQGILMYFERFKHFSINANLGADWRDYNLYINTSSTSNLILHDIASLSNSAEAIQSSESLETMRKESLFGDLTFGYRDLLYLDITGRNDWNSTLPINNCSFFYPSASLSFLFPEVFKIPKNILSFGKLRASWAEVGNGTSFNQLYNNFIYSGLFNTIPIFGLGSTLKNSGLKPETTFSNEIGTDLRFFNNKLSLDLTYYSSRSINEIVNPNISPSTGYTTGTFNAGEIHNNGIEVSMNVKPIEKKDFSWDMTFNWAKNNNKVVSISDSLSSMTIYSVSSALQITAEKGKPFGILRGSTQKRDADGNLMVNAATGLPFIQNNADLGNVNADFTGSFRSSFRVKNFDFSFMLDYKAGGKLFSLSSLNGNKQGNWLPTLANRANYTFSGTVLGESALERLGQNNDEPALAYPNPDNRVMGAMFQGMVYSYNTTTGVYTKVGPNTNLFIQPQSYWSQSSSYLMDKFIYDASFIKLREVTVGYTLPVSILSKTKVKSVRFSLVGRNLATLFKNTPQGVDPQSTASTGNAQGIEAGFTLPTAYYGFDLKVTF